MDTPDLTGQANLIEATVEKLDESGWCQNTSYNPHTGEYCTAGAFATVRWNTLGEWLGVETVTWELLTLEAQKKGFRDIPNYNDHPGRTYSEVRDFLLGVAKDLRNGS